MFFWFFWRKSNKIEGFSLFYFSPTQKLDAQTQNLKNEKIANHLKTYTSDSIVNLKNKLIIKFGLANKKYCDILTYKCVYTKWMQIFAYDSRKKVSENKFRFQKIFANKKSCFKNCTIDFFENLNLGKL